MDTLPAEPRAAADQFWTDWVHAIHAMFEANAKDGEQGDYDPDQNRAIGQILTGLSEDASAA